MMLIRLAQTRDRYPIESLYSTVTGSALTLSDDEWYRLVASEGVLVAEEHNQIVGFGGGHVTAREQIRWLYLLPHFQRNGLGSRILAELEELIWRSGMSAIRLHSTRNAVDFYSKRGYKEVPDHEQFGHDHEGVEMIKVRSDSSSS